MNDKMKSLLHYEQKRFFTKPIWICIVSFLVVSILIWGWLYKQRDVEKCYDEIIKEFQGPTTDEKLDEIIYRAEYYENIIASYAQVTDDYAREKITDEYFEQYMQDYKYANKYMEAWQLLKKHAEYLKDTGKTTDIFYDLGWEKIFEKQIEWPLLFLFVVLFVPFFYKDVDANYIPMEKSYCNYKKVRKIRFWYAILILVSMLLVWFGAKLAIVATLNELPEWYAAVCSLECCQAVSHKISILFFLLAKVFVMLILHIIALVVLHVLSIAVKNKMQTTVIMMLLLAFVQYVQMDLLVAIL